MDLTANNVTQSNICTVGAVASIHTLAANNVTQINITTFGPVGIEAPDGVFSINRTGDSHIRHNQDGATRYAAISGSRGISTGATRPASTGDRRH